MESCCLTHLIAFERKPEEDGFVSDLKAIVYAAKAKAYQAADLYNVASNWLVGRRIVEQSSMVRLAPNMGNTWLR